MLTLSGVTHVYANGTRALDNTTLDIPKGMFGLVDPYNKRIDRNSDDNLTRVTLE